MSQDELNHSKPTKHEIIFAITWLAILIGLPAFWIYIFISLAEGAR